MTPRSLLAWTRPRLTRRTTALRTMALAAAGTLAASLVIVAPLTSAHAAETLLSQGKSVTSSSNESAGTPPEAAVDGNPATRWSSTFSDPQWIRIDLGANATISRVVLSWEAAYATAFQIQTSADGNTWTPIYTTTTGTGGTQTLTVTGSGQYIRMYGTTRANGYGYSLWEFQVFGMAGAGSPSPGGNWTTVWSDDFTGAVNTSPPAANWLLRTGTQFPGGAANWGTGEVETASDSTANVYLDGAGKLTIKAIRDGAGNWTSGRVETQRTDFAPQPGEQLKFTAVLQQPNVANGLGYWPAFRATGAAYRGNFTNWPGIGETDIMSGVNGRSQLSNTLHCGTAPDGVCGEYNGRTSGLATCAGCQTGYHEYSQIIDRTKTDEEIRFYLDGAQTWIVRESQVGVAAWEAAVHHGFYLRFDLAIGGQYPTAIAGESTPTPDTTSGGTLSVDSVSVARLAGSTPVALTDPATPAGPSTVAVTGSQGNWQLRINGAGYEVRGLTYGPPQAAADGYLRDLKSMGVNTIRTWGVDDTNTPTLLNRAAQQGIKVVVGHWLNQGADYVNDTTYKTNVKNEIVARVNALKGYQGVLLWDVGNEVILTMQNFGLSAADVEARRIAYAQFVNEVAVAIHAADPNHPVTSTDAWTGAWPYYKNYAPALDLLAVNSYGAIGTVKQAWIDGGYTKPYIVTEGGPDGEWEVPNDVNGVPTEPTDLQKKAQYTASWNAVKSHPGVALGATEFHYGLENDFGGVWLNTFTGGWHRLGYYALKQAYTGQASTNTPPEITSMTVGSQTSVPAGAQFTVNVAAADPQGDPIRYNLMFSNKHITGNTGLDNVRFTQTGPGQFSATAPQQMGVWKVYVYAYDGQGNVGIEQKSFRVVPPPVSGTNVAQGKATTASSYQPTGPNGPQLPSYATDGNFTTRWASNWTAAEWLQVDLGQPTTINHIQLAWEAAYAKGYQIQVSNDGTNWQTIYSTTTGNGGFDDIDVTGSGRYVRMNGTERGTTYGYSLWEFGVYKS
jgi:exo-beta-1,3-glucanase (GH17 family)